MGLHQYNGALYNICRYESSPPENATVWEFLPDESRACTQSGLGNYFCPDSMYCGNNYEHPSISLSTDDIPDRAYLDYGIINFDNLGNSLLSVFMIINSDTWYTKLLNLMDVDIPIIGIVYCIMMIIFGQFFLMNLILAVIIFSFMKTQKQDLE